MTAQPGSSSSAGGSGGPARTGELGIFRWIEDWYNPERIQRPIGWRTHNGYDVAFHAGEELKRLRLIGEVTAHLARSSW
jgi:hypothetical protein